MHLLEAHNISKRFGTATALDNVNLSVEKGEIFGIIGLSGAGKSTLIRCLAGTAAPTSGKVLFQGAPIQENIGNFRKESGMIFQQFNLFSSRNAAENISFPLEIRGIPREERIKRTDELLELVGLTAKSREYPATLSGGEKQRVGIARAIATRPQILFCDEATSALDPKSTKEILDLLKSINKKLGVTILLITHDMEVIRRIATRVAVMQDGRVVETASVSELFANPKERITEELIRGSSHEIPSHFFKDSSPKRKLLRLKFCGQSAEEPLISKMIRTLNVDANILLGWVDNVQETMIGTLIIELLGDPDPLEKALQFLHANGIQTEELKR